MPPGPPIKLGAQQSSSAAAAVATVRTACQGPQRQRQRRPSRLITIETRRSSQQYVSIPRRALPRQSSASSMNHDHDHRQHHHDQLRVSRDAWDDLVAREQALDTTNQGLLDEVRQLKAGLTAAEAETARLGAVVVPELEWRVIRLDDEKQALLLLLRRRRRQLDEGGSSSNSSSNGGCGRHRVEIEALRSRIGRQDGEMRRLECDKARLGQRVEALLLLQQKQEKLHLSSSSSSRDEDGDGDGQETGSSGCGCGCGCGKRIEELVRHVAQWKDDFLDMQYRRNVLSDLADEKESKIRACEDVLRRNGLISA